MTSNLPLPPPPWTNSDNDNSDPWIFNVYEYWQLMDATLQPSRSSSSSATPPNMGSARRWARRLERSCCACAKYFPLAFVYGLTTWAAFVLVSLCTNPTKVSWLGESVLGILVMVGVLLRC